MSFRGPRAPGAKLAFAAVVAAALARVALASGDPVSLTFLGGGAHDTPVPRSVGRDQFERIVAALEAVEPGGDASLDSGMVDRALHSLARATRRGAIVVFLSDLLDLPPGAAEQIAAIAPMGRVLGVVQTLYPAEAEFPYTGTVRLRSLEGATVVETDAETTRERYLEALAALTRGWEQAVVRRDGRFRRATTDEDLVSVVRSVVESVR